jgi:hypothetical protein
LIDARRPRNRRATLPGNQRSKYSRCSTKLSYNARSAGRIRTCNPRMNDVTLIFTTGNSGKSILVPGNKRSRLEALANLLRPKRRNLDLSPPAKISQSGNNQRERASGRAPPLPFASRLRLRRDGPFGARQSSHSALHYGWRKYLPLSTTDWILTATGFSRCRYQVTSSLVPTKGL